MEISFKAHSKYALVFSSILSISLISCGTVSNVAQNGGSETQNFASDDSGKTESEKNPAPEMKIPTAAEIYKEKTAGISLKIESFPGETTKGRAFSKPYVVKAADADGNAAKNLGIAVLLPYSSEKKVLLTDDNGAVSFLPETPAKSMNSEIRFYPDGDTFDAEIAEAAEKLSVSAPYKVQTNLKSAGGLIAVVDFSQSGKPITSNPVSSSNLLMSLMQLGFTRVGNIDLTNEVLKDDALSLQRKAKSLVGNSSSYLIYGTVKYKSAEKKGDGTSEITLAGNLKCLDLKTGEIMLEEEKESSASGKNEWNVLRDARKNLADEFAKSLKYGI